MKTDDRFLRMSQVLERTALSRRTLYRLISRGEFPSSRRASPRVPVWLESEIVAWMEKVAA